MTRAIRLLPFASLDGSTNMAADEAMFESACEKGIASLRFYTWKKPTLTLGYFQPASVREQLPMLASLPWVRRSTGGAAIVHHRELTYSFALPGGSDWKYSESRICGFHRLVQCVLKEEGVASSLLVCGEEQKLGDVLCFLHQTPGDLIANGSKVAGSAQRKLRGALLQHGSLLLERSEFAPNLPGMHDLAGRELFSVRSLAERLALRFAEDASTAIEHGEWMGEERARIEAIEAEKYANPEWNAKR